VHCLQQQHENFERLRHFHNAFERIPGLGCDKCVTLLYTLSFHGCHKLVKVVLKEQISVNAQGGPFGNALQAASAEGNKEVVGMLLEKGADVNAPGGLYGNALQAASARGNKEVVGMLLEKGADVNAQGGLCGNALQAAESKDEIDLNRNRSVYRPPSTYHHRSKFVIIITTFAVFFHSVKNRGLERY